MSTSIVLITKVHLPPWVRELSVFIVFDFVEIFEHKTRKFWRRSVRKSAGIRFRGEPGTKLSVEFNKLQETGTKCETVDNLLNKLPE